MIRYARIDGIAVVAIIEPLFYEIDSPPGSAYDFKAGDEVPIERRFHPDFVATCQVIPEGLDVQVGWTFASGEFEPPAE